MAHADPSGAKKRSTRKTKSTRDEDAFVYDFGLPPVHFPSATDQQLKTEESHKGDTPLNTVHALSPQQQQMLAVYQILAEPNHLAQQISLVQAERDKLALELELLRFKQAQSTPPPPSGAAKGQGTSASPPMTRKKRHVDWPHEFCPGSFISIPTLDAFAQRLLDLAFADSTHRNMKSHISFYTKFCRSVSCPPWPYSNSLSYTLRRLSYPLWASLWHNH